MSARCSWAISANASRARWSTGASGKPSGSAGDCPASCLAPDGLPAMTMRKIMSGKKRRLFMKSLPAMAASLLVIAGVGPVQRGNHRRSRPGRRCRRLFPQPGQRFRARHRHYPEAQRDHRPCDGRVRRGHRAGVVVRSIAARTGVQEGGVHACRRRRIRPRHPVGKRDRGSRAR